MRPIQLEIAELTVSNRKVLKLSTRTEESGPAPQGMEPAVSTTEVMLSGSEKKISPFRYGKAGSQPSMQVLPSVSERMPRCQAEVKEPVQLSGPDLLLVPVCDHSEQVEPGEFGKSFRVFKDRLGKCWKCFMPMTCDHAIVMNGAIHSCRLRTHQISELESARSEVNP